MGHTADSQSSSRRAFALAIGVIDGLLLAAGLVVERLVTWWRGRTAHDRRRWVVAAGLAVLAIGATLAFPGPQSATASSSLAPKAGDDPVGRVRAMPLPPPTLPPAAQAGAAPSQPWAEPVPNLPTGKGMWLHLFNKSNGGDPISIVQHAKNTGLTHLYLRLGSSRMGFYAQAELDRLLPVAHKAGLKIVGWDFPYLHDPTADAMRAASMISYRTPTGDGIDAFSADIETPSEGTHLTTEGVVTYGRLLRQQAGPTFPLIAAVPRPSPKRSYPYAEVVADFDAIAPMVYWVNRDPATDVAGAITALRHFNKPIIPVGQAYDPGIDGSHSWGPPTGDDLHRFMRTAAEWGASGMSFWVWNTASPEQWQAIAQSKWFQLSPITDGPDRPFKVAELQRVLRVHGQDVAADGTFGPRTEAALKVVQQAVGLVPTGQLDNPTLAKLKTAG